MQDKIGLPLDDIHILGNVPQCMLFCFVFVSTAWLGIFVIAYSFHPVHCLIAAKIAECICLKRQRGIMVNGWVIRTRQSVPLNRCYL